MVNVRPPESRRDMVVRKNVTQCAAIPLITQSSVQIPYAYGIELASEAPYEYPSDPEWAYLVTGYSECIDSFFAFGLFEAARRSGFFPPEQSMSAEDISVRELMLLCLGENDRRFAGYDKRLQRPQTMPKLTRLALRFMRTRKP